MKITSLYSGSSGNCILFEHNDCNILIDSGMPAVRILSMLDAAGVDPHKIDALLITHEHDDHISGAGVIARKLDLPLYFNMKTYEASKRKLGKINEDKIHIFETGKCFLLKDIEIMPFETSHDAAEPVGYTFTDGITKAAVATDTGILTEQMKKNLLACKSVFLESNHDVDMLLNGSYPIYLKERILGEYGHLSNETAANFCVELIEHGTEHLGLGHLSKENNSPLSALNTTVRRLNENKIRLNNDYTIIVARRDEISETLLCI